MMLVMLMRKLLLSNNYRRCPNHSSETISSTHRITRETGMLPSVRTLSKRKQEGAEVNFSHSKVCRIFHDIGLYTFHVQKVQHLKPHE